METPKNTPGVADLIVWANQSFDLISEVTNKAFLSVCNKKNMRQLTKAEVGSLEALKVDILTNLSVMYNKADENYLDF